MEAKVIKIKRNMASLTELKNLRNDFIGSNLQNRLEVSNIISTNVPHSNSFIIVGSISKTVMNDVPSVPIGDFEISKTLSVSPARKLRSVSGLPHISPWEMYHARPALLTVLEMLRRAEISMEYRSSKLSPLPTHTQMSLFLSTRCFV
jgi:hypothetical protein